MPPGTMPEAPQSPDANGGPGIAIRPTGLIPAGSNDFGIGGRWYWFSDGTGTSVDGLVPGEIPYDASRGGMCLVGATNGASGWGAGLGFSTQNADGIPYDPKGITGFRFTTMGTSSAPLRVQFVTRQGDASPFVPLPQASGVFDACIGDAQVPVNWDVPNAGEKVGDELHAVELAAVGGAGEPPGSFDLCVTKVEVLAGPCGPEECIVDCGNRTCGDDGCGGVCGQCEEGQACVDGSCAVACPPAGDAPARGLRIGEVALYQGVKVPLMQDGSEVVPRNADVVRGRGALVRVFVVPSSAFTPREITARLTWHTQYTGEAVWEQTRLVQGASMDASIETTFNFDVPTSFVREDARYEVELRETASCPLPPGDVAGARFPAAGRAELKARDVGQVQVVLVPIVSLASQALADREPNTSQELIAAFRQYVHAFFPTREPRLTVRNTVYTGINIGDGSHANAGEVRDDWRQLLSELRVMRQQAGAARDVHWYGLMNPVDSRGLGGIASVDFSGSAVTAGTGLGLGRQGGDAWIFAHELGHMHGLFHAPCGTSETLDPDFPYSNGGIGVWGYNIASRQLYDPVYYSGITAGDFMGYCSQRWISDYHYQRLAEQMVLLSEPLLALEGPDVTYRSLVLGPQGAPKWGRVYRRVTRSEGRPELARVLDAAGSTILQLSVFRVELDHDGGAIIDVPFQPKPSWVALQVNGAPPHRFDAADEIPPLRSSP